MSDPFFHHRQTQALTSDSETRTDSSDERSAKRGTDGTCPPASKSHLVPRLCTLDGFAQQISHQGGIDVTQLEPLTRLVVRTQNTHYQITVLDPAESKVLIRGGRFFPEQVEADVCGASFGGNFLKMHWLGLGMRMEVNSQGRFIVTSPVSSVEFEDDSNLPGPF